MNDFLMNSLAADRVDGLRAEADRHRLARVATPRRLPSRAAPSPRRFDLSWLLRRAAV